MKNLSLPATLLYSTEVKVFTQIDCRGEWLVSEVVLSSNMHLHGFVRVVTLPNNFLITGINTGTCA